MTAPDRRVLRTPVLCISLIFGTAGAVAAAGLSEECRPPSSFVKLIAADEIERKAAEQYAQVIERARERKALAPTTHPQVVRLRHILDRLLMASDGCNERARAWNWEINLIGSTSRDTWGLPGGKLAVSYGLLNELQLDDDELASAIAHLVAQSLLEQARERMGRLAVTRSAVAQGMEMLKGPGAASDPVATVAADVMSAQFSGEQTLRADRLALTIAARAGYDPAAAPRLLRKIAPAAAAAPSAPFGTPLHERRISAIEPLLQPAAAQYEQALKPIQRFAPPPKPKD